MKIVYVCQYFPPEMGAPSARVFELSRSWARAGHDVTVVTGFANHPTGVKAPADRGVLTRRERVEGIDVLRCYLYAAANKGVALRMASFASFMASAAVLGSLRIASADVVIASSPQLLVGPAGYALAKRLRCPFVFEVRDLWPESIDATGVTAPGPVTRALKRLAAELYERCDHLVTVGPGYKRKLVDWYGVDPGKIDIVTAGIDTSVFKPLPRDNEVRARHGWGDRFVVMYVGTHGTSHALHKVLEAAEAMREQRDVQFVLVGEGAEKERLAGIVREKKLANVELIGQQPKSVLPLYYAACDLGLVTLRDTPLFEEVIPSKIFEYLGMERAVLVSARGEPVRVVLEAGGGYAVEPEDVPAMVAAILRAKDSRAELEAMGAHARRFVLEHYDREALAQRYLGLLEGVLANAR